MSNRRERRAQARANPATNIDVPLHQPSRAAPTHRTLFDIASERQLLNTTSRSVPSSITNTKINPNGTLSSADSASDPLDATMPYLDVFLYTATLTMLHFTLTVLVHHQYATTPPSLTSILYTSTIASPTPVLLLILVSLLHPWSSHLPTQILFAFLSMAAGAWLVHASNEDLYMAVMKKAPPLGTLWVWAIVEMRWEWAVGCLGAVAGWGWWRGHAVLELMMVFWLGEELLSGIRNSKSQDLSGLDVKWASQKFREWRKGFEMRIAAKRTKGRTSTKKRTIMKYAWL